MKNATYKGKVEISQCTIPALRCQVDGQGGRSISFQEKCCSRYRLFHAPLYSIAGLPEAK
jgi:hypothetical protein